MNPANNKWEKGRGRLNCLWSLYHEPWEPHHPTSADVDFNNKFIGDADTGELFLTLVAQLMVTKPTGTILLFRKHIRPHWADLRFGCHFSITPGPSQQSVNPNFLDIMFMIVDEQFKAAPLVAGVGLCRDREHYLFTVWLINENENLVGGFRKELSNLFSSDASIHFVSHSLLPLDSLQDDPSKRCLGPILDICGARGPSSVEQPLPLLAATLQHHNGLASHNPLGEGNAATHMFADYSASQSFNGLHQQQQGAQNSAVSFTMEALGRNADSSFLRPRPSPAGDWTLGWTPSSFAVLPKEADRSDSSKGTSLTVHSESPHSAIAPHVPAPITVVYHSPPHAMMQQQPGTHHVLIQGPPPQPTYVQAPTTFVPSYVTMQPQPLAPPPYGVPPPPTGNVMVMPSYAPAPYGTMPPPPPMMYDPNQHHHQHHQHHQHHHQHHHHHHHQQHLLPPPRGMGMVPRSAHLQSERKPFVYNGYAFPPGLNRKEYRTVIHHSDERGMHPQAFAVQDQEDGELEIAEYYELKRKYNNNNTKAKVPS